DLILCRRGRDGCALGQQYTDLEKHLLQAGGRQQNQHPRRLVTFVLERVGRSDPHAGKNSSSCHDPFVTDRKRDLAVEYVESLFFTTVNVRRRTAARLHDRFKHGVFAIRIIARRKKSICVAHYGNRPALSSCLYCRWSHYSILIGSKDSSMSSPASLIMTLAPHHLIKFGRRSSGNSNRSPVLTGQDPGN